MRSLEEGLARRPKSLTLAVCRLPKAATEARWIPKILSIAEALSISKSLLTPEARRIPESLSIAEALRIPKSLLPSEARRIPKSLLTPEARLAIEGREIPEFYLVAIAATIRWLAAKVHLSRNLLLVARLLPHIHTELAARRHREQRAIVPNRIGQRGEGPREPLVPVVISPRAKR